MNWEALGAVGELIAAGGVIASLIFLAIQVRISAKATTENNRLLSATMYRNSDEYITRWTEHLIRDPELNDVWERGLEGGELDQLDSARFYMLARNYFGVHAVSYYEYAAVSSPESRDEMISYMADRIVRSPGLRNAWQAMATTPFRSYSEYFASLNAAIEVHQSR